MKTPEESQYPEDTWQHNLDHKFPPRIHAEKALFLSNEAAEKIHISHTWLASSWIYLDETLDWPPTYFPTHIIFIGCKYFIIQLYSDQPHPEKFNMRLVSEWSTKNKTCKMFFDECFQKKNANGSQ